MNAIFSMNIGKSRARRNEIKSRCRFSSNIFQRRLLSKKENWILIPNILYYIVTSLCTEIFFNFFERTCATWSVKNNNLRLLDSRIFSTQYLKKKRCQDTVTLNFCGDKQAAMLWNCDYSRLPFLYNIHTEKLLAT